METKRSTNGARGAASSTESETRTVIVIITLIVLFLLGGLYTNKRKSQEQFSENGAGSTSIKALMALGVPQKCSFSVKNNDAGGESVSSGMVYVSGGKIRADTETRMNVEGKETNMVGHMFSDGEYYYMWSDADPTRGIKTKITEGIPAAGGEPAQNPPINPEVAMDYRCSAKISDASKLEIPNGVTFVDMNEMMGGMMQNQNGVMSP